MQRRYAPNTILALPSGVIRALPISAAPVSAAPAPAQLDDEVNRQLQTTPASGLIPVIIEGAADGSAPASSPALRAQRVESRVRSNGGRVDGRSLLLGASVAELTPAQIRALSSD